MGFFEKLFQGQQISEEEQRRRMGGNASLRETADRQKPVREMSEEEKLHYWARGREISDIRERMKRMEELAEAGFDAAYVSLIDGYFDLAEETHTEIAFDKVEYWARKAAQAGLPAGHTHLGMLYASPKYGEVDLENAAAEYLLAIEGGDESAVRLLGDFWNHEIHIPDRSEEENAEYTAAFRQMLTETLEPEIERLRAENGEKTFVAFGLLYYYGIYFEQDLDKAKEYFIKLDEIGNSLGRRMLANPVLEDDEDYED